MTVDTKEREDGRFEVSVNGYVRWCGTSRETMEAMRRSLLAGGTNSPPGALDRAIARA